MKTEKHWKSIGRHSHHGLWIPLFALRADEEKGIGSFLDLTVLIDWCKKIGFDTLQLLPLNDTGSDPSPYNPISSCALDPVYLSIPHLQEAKNRKEIKAQKLEYLYQEFKRTDVNIDPFQNEHPWVENYGKYLGDVDFYSFVQYRCFTQMNQVKKHATKRGIFLVGDLPHLVSQESADVSSHPELFHQNLGAGAPPDLYNPQGQNWGFPLYNWETMREQKFGWWKQRLKAIESLYHIYRIDHVVGLFRIWAIAPGKKATEGGFIPHDESLWMDLGREILEMMIGSSPLLPFAEDLGTIPKGVYPILKDLGICGTKVLRWEKGAMSDFEPYSITTVSTPDTEPLSVYDPSLNRNTLFDLLKKAHATPSYFHINLLQEYLRAFPELSWEDPCCDRINVPGTLKEDNWLYRFRPTLPEIISHPPLSQLLKNLS